MPSQASGPRSVTGLVVKDGVRLAVIGVVIGMAAAAATTRVLSAVLYGVSATDVVTFSVVALLLLGVAFVASYVPARRAAKLDPAEALHYG